MPSLAQRLLTGVTMKKVAILFLLTLACNSEAPPDPGPRPYETLNAEERAVIDRGRDVAGWRRVHRELAAVVLENARGAARAARSGR